MGQLLSLPLSPLLGESYVSRFESSATQLLGDRRPQFPYLYNGANKCCLTSAHEFLGGSDGSLKGTWELLGGTGLGGSQWDGKTQSLELQGWALPHLSPCFTVPPSPLPCRNTRGRCCVKSRQTGPLPPRPAPACGLPPASPALLLAHCLGCLCRAEPSRPGSGEAAGTIPTPWAGGPAGAGSGHLKQDSRPGHPSPLGGPLDSGGVSWKGGLRHLSAYRAYCGSRGV